VLGAMDDAAFESKIAEARAWVSRVFRRAVREVEIEQERQERRARTATGGSVADLHALIASGFRAGTIAIDPNDAGADFAESINDCYRAVRERVAAGGKGWTAMSAKKHVAPKPRGRWQWVCSCRNLLGIVAEQAHGTWGVIKLGAVVSTHPTREAEIAALQREDGR
jgi:hypothetical protein